MKTQLTKEQLKVMLAYEEGAMIECDLGVGELPFEWVHVPNPKWYWDCCKYRVKEVKKSTKMIYKVLLALSLALLLVSCTSGLGQQLKTSQSFSEAQNSTIKQESTNHQDAYQVQGASVQGEVQEVNTDNSSGMEEYWFIIGALLFGLIMPQPTVVRAMFT